GDLLRSRAHLHPLRAAAVHADGRLSHERPPRRAQDARRGSLLRARHRLHAAPARLPRVAAALVGVALAIAPVTALNYAASGRFVLLTMSSGHAFYLGHNPQARAGYYLPDRVGAVQSANRGSIFDSMHRIAEETAGHPMPDEEVSGFYFRKAWEHVTSDPG